MIQFGTKVIVKNKLVKIRKCFDLEFEDIYKSASKFGYDCEYLYSLEDHIELIENYSIIKKPVYSKLSADIEGIVIGKRTVGYEREFEYDDGENYSNEEYYVNGKPRIVVRSSKVKSVYLVAVNMKCILKVCEEDLMIKNN